MKKVDENEARGFWMGANDIENERIYVSLDGSEGKIPKYIYRRVGKSSHLLKFRFIR